jgi:hypothetical protein
MSVKFNSLGQWSTPPAETLKKTLPKGADVSKEAVSAGNVPILQDAKKQPTDEEMFGHLVVTEEMAKKHEQDWEDTIARNLREVRKPIDKLNKSAVDDRVWEPGKSFNSMLTDEEKRQRNKDLGN